MKLASHGSPKPLFRVQILAPLHMLVDNLIEQGWLKTDSIIQAFKKIHRKDFLPDNIKSLAEENRPLSIGFNQINSQPLTVAFMLELLQPEPGDKILDIGCGSGWTTALLSQIVGDKGKVIGIEIIPQLADLATNNISKYNFNNKGVTQIICKNGMKGYEQEAPFDKILASASGKNIPKDWIKQLKIGGKVVAPINTSIWVFEKKSEKEIIKKQYPGFSFVPLINKLKKHI